MGNVGVVKLQRQHSVPVPCGLQVLHHSSQQSGVGIVGYKFRSTNVHGFIFGPRSLEIGVLHVPYSECSRVSWSELLGLMSHCQRNVFCDIASWAKLLLEFMVHVGHFQVVVFEDPRFRLLFLCCPLGSIVSTYELLRKGSEPERVQYLRWQ